MRRNVMRFFSNRTNRETLLRASLIILIILADAVFILSNKAAEHKQGNILASSPSEVQIPVRLKDEFSTTPHTRSVDSILNAFMDRWNIRGASVAIAKDGELVYSKGLGYAQEENWKEATTHHLFRMASASKLVTATAIMKLKEKGVLALDDKVFGESGILDQFSDIKDPRVKEITVEHLLKHKGGWTTRWGDHMFIPLVIADEMNVDPPPDLETIIRFALQRPLHFKPGAYSSYCNLGYAILGKVIEERTGQSYESYVQDSIMVPLDVDHMKIGNNLRKDRDSMEVRYYEHEGARKRLSCYGTGEKVPKSSGGTNIKTLGAAGGWIGSAKDMVRLVTSLDTANDKDNILSSESIYDMAMHPRGTSPIGWKNTAPDEGVWWRTGTLAGTSALIMRKPNGFTWAIITNTSTWKGAMFPENLQRVMEEAVASVEKWPEHDLFNPVKSVELGKSYADIGS